MSSNENELNELRNQLAALQQNLQQRPPPPANLMTGWAPPPQQQAELSIIGVSVPVSVQTQAGTVRVYLALPAECANNMAVLQRTVENLMNAGVPVDAWQPRSGGYGGSRFNRGGGYR